MFKKLRPRMSVLNTLYGNCCTGGLIWGLDNAVHVCSIVWPNKSFHHPLALLDSRVFHPKRSSVSVMVPPYRCRKVVQIDSLRSVLKTATFLNSPHDPSPNVASVV
eukprot:PhF_6_TR38614/c0_g1_i1/m.57523